MTQKYEYLTDQELEQLIAGVEQHELVQAPPGLMDGILGITEREMPGVSGTEGQEPAGIESPEERFQAGSASRKESGPVERQQMKTGPEEKIREFRSYCCRVVTSAAAAVILVFAIPTFDGIPKTDPVSGYSAEIRSRYRNRSESTEDGSFLMSAFSGTRFFGQNSQKIFSNKNGG